jgi:predicted TPR repeat methyltransferase
MSAKKKKEKREQKKGMEAKSKKVACAGNIREIYGIALQHHRGGRFKEAEYRYRQILTFMPGDADIYCNLGGALHGQGKLDEAAECFRDALSRNPDHILSIYNLGNVLKAEGRPEEAEAHYRQAIGLDKNHIGSHFNLGNICMDQARFDEAAECFREVIKISPNHLASHLNLGNVLKEKGLFDEAITAYRNVLALDPKNATSLYNIAIILRILGKVEEAIESYRQTIEMDPENADAYNNLGNLLKDKGRLDEAVSCFKRAVEIDKENVSALHTLSALTGETPETAPKKYVRELYDRYADNFDVHLTEKLDYDIPSVVREMFDALLDVPARFENILDMGCGTGLSGLKFRAITGRLCGVDISPVMIEKSRERNIYNSLVAGDMVEYLNESHEQYDLFIATDVFIYTGDLQSIFHAVRRRSKEGAYFTFSTEGFEGDDYILRTTGRYAHSVAYIKRLAGENGFDIEMRRQEVIRMEKGQEIMGDVYILKYKG